MAIARKNFTDRQKAEIYTLDRALCTFSGKSLWLLDYGAAPSTVDWADHIIPASKGGNANVDNGACASWLFNWIKGHQNALHLFHRGRPTADFYTFHETVPEEIAKHILRFSTLHWSDWYFNRAVFHVLLAAGQNNQRRMDGKPFTRGRDYWATAAMKCLETWATGATETDDFKIRGLLLRSPSHDQLALRSLASASTVSEIKRLIADLAPYVAASWQAMSGLTELEDAKEARAYLREVRKDQYVVPRTKNAVSANIERLYPRGNGT